jgi:hypothetical protein
MLIGAVALASGCATAPSFSGRPHPAKRAQKVRKAPTRLEIEAVPSVHQAEPSTEGGQDAASDTREALLDLEDQYDISPFLFTRKIRIQSGAKPHAHPILTLNTAGMLSSEVLLSQFIHQEMQWFLDSRPDDLKAALRELRRKYPGLEAAMHRESLSGHDQATEGATYYELIVCWLEYQALKYYLGTEKAQGLARSLPHFTFIYEAVLRDEREIGQVIRKYRLLPRPLH